MSPLGGGQERETLFASDGQVSGLWSRPWYSSFSRARCINSGTILANIDAGK